MFKKLLVLSTLGLCVFLTACNTAYKQSGSGSLYGYALGYDDKKIGDNKWYISYSQSVLSSESEVLKGLYRRAKEVGDRECKGSYTTTDANVNTKKEWHGGEMLKGGLVLSCK